MHRLAVSLSLIAAILSSPLSPRANPQEPQTTAPACPTTASLDDLTKALDAAVSGPADKDRTCFRALFLPDARLIPYHTADDGSIKSRVLSVEDWIDAVKKRGSDVFYESQIKVRSESWAHIAHLWSTYETRTTPDGKPPAGKVLDRGINSIQAVYDGKQWHVIEIIWQAETPAEPLPEKYLP